MIFLVIGSILLLGGAWLVWKYGRKKQLTHKEKQDFLHALSKLITTSTPREGVIFLDALYHKILLKAGYIGTFGEILRQRPAEITDLNLIWKLHKVRNSLAHNADELSMELIKDTFGTYQKEIKKLLDRF